MCGFGRLKQYWLELEIVCQSAIGISRLIFAVHWRFMIFGVLVAPEVTENEMFHGGIVEPVELLEGLCYNCLN
jgi:hypothetical protein